MDIHTATELSYKNGYEKGYEKGKNEAIKHGYWHDSYCIDEEHYMATCSNCGHTQKQHMNDLFIYCPNCGSKNVETVD